MAKKNTEKQAPKAAKAPKAPKAAAPKAPKAAAPKAAEKAPALAIHINKTGRVCFGKDAAVRLGGIEAINKHMAMKIEEGLVRIDIAAPGADTLPIRDGGGRPYISATRQFKPLGFDGSKPYDLEAKPYGTAGFEFRLS